MDIECHSWKRPRLHNWRMWGWCGGPKSGRMVLSAFHPVCRGEVQFSPLLWRKIFLVCWKITWTWSFWRQWCPSSLDLLMIWQLIQAGVWGQACDLHLSLWVAMWLCWHAILWASMSIQVVRCNRKTNLWMLEILTTFSTAFKILLRNFAIFNSVPLLWHDENWCQHSIPSFVSLLL